MTAIRNLAGRKRGGGATPRSRLTFGAVAFALLFGVLATGGRVQAGPEGGKVISGTADIVQSSPTDLDIRQSSDKAVIDWRSFSIDVDEHTRFLQPSSSSITLNRVKGGAYSRILGRLTANGRILLINPNGILFGKNARVDVSGLVATTIDIRNEDFAAGRFDFGIGGNPAGTVVNRGGITAAEGGLVAFVAPGVENSGVIRARLGRIALASGNSFTLDLYGDSLIRLKIDDRVAERLFAPDGARLKALAGNRGAIRADGGTVVLLAAGAARDIVDYAINMDGIIEARSAVKRKGLIVLEGTGQGIVRMAGTLDASGRGSGETGGTVKVLGEKVGIVGSARVDVSGQVGGGKILVGGAFQGRGPERNASYTTVGGNATLLADAISRGHGGRVIVWSDRVTRFFGSISGRGGSISGNGGFAEVSGKLHLQFDPTSIDLGAAHGMTGDLLLDPRDITISDTDGTNDNKIGASDTSINFGDDAGTDYRIKPSAFESVNADITIQATRDITVSSPIDRSGAANSTLHLQAGRHLTINANITGTNGKHSFIFEADSPRSGVANNDGTGKLTIASRVAITSNNGDITLIGAAFSIASDANIRAGTGNVFVARSQSVAMNINATADNLNTSEIRRIFSTGTVQIGSAVTGPTGSNAAGSSISVTDIILGSPLTFTRGANVIFRGSGNITISAAISLSTSAATTLTLAAGGNLTISANITGASGARSLIFEADSPNAGSANNGVGTLTIASGLTITSNNGAITLIGGALTINSTLNAGSGNVFVAPSTSAQMAIGTTGFLTSANVARFNTSGTIQIGTATTGPTSTLAAGMSISAGSLTVSQALSLTSGKSLALDSGGTTTLNANVTTADGNITFKDPVTLGTAISIDSDTNNNLTDGKITFTSTVNGAHVLTLDADTADVELQGAVGGTTKLTNLTITGANISLSAVSLSGTLSLTPSGTITLKGNITIDDNPLSFSRPVVLGGNVVIDTDGDNDNTDGPITFTSTVNGAYALTLDADANIVEFQGVVGGTTKLASLTVAEAGQVDVKAVHTTGAISIKGTNIDLNAGTYESDDGAVTFTGPVDLTVNTTIDSDKDNDTADGAITFTSTVDGAFSLTLDASTGNVGLQGAVGGTTKLTSLTLTGANISLSAVSLSGTLTLTPSGTITLKGNITVDDSNVSFSRPVVLAGNVTIDTDGDNDLNDGNITFSSTVNATSAGMQSLTLDADGGQVVLNGAVGGTTKLSNLTITGFNVTLNAVTLGGALSLTLAPTGTITLKGNITTDDSAVSFGKAVTLGGNVTIDTDGDNDATDGAITFSKAVNGAFALTLDADGAAVTLSEDAGGTTKLASLTITGGQIDVKNVKTTGAIGITGTNIDLNAGTYESDDGSITFTGPVDLTVNTTIDSDKDNDSTDGAISFSSTVNGGKTLTLDADGGNVTLGGPAGGTTKLTGLTITGGVLSLKAVKATGTIAVTGTTSIDLDGAYEADDGNITFTGAVWLAGDVSADSDKDNDFADGAITFTSTINGPRSLTLDASTGNVGLQGAVGGAAKLTDLTITGRDIRLSAVTLGGTLTLTSGRNILLGGNITTDDTDVSFGRVVTLIGNVTIDTDGDNDTSDGSITFSRTVNGAYALTLDADTGNVTLSATLGGSARPTSLTVTGGAVSLKAVLTTGAIAVTGTGIQVGGSLGTAIESNDGAITFTGPVTLSDDITVDSDADNDSTDGNITFSSTINGAKTLTLDADSGNVDLQGAVGGSTKLTDLTITGADISLSAVSLSGTLSLTPSGTITLKGNITVDDSNVSFSRPVVLAGNVTIDTDGDSDATDGTISFSSTINGSHALTLDADGAAVTLSGAAGGTTKLASLTITGGQIDVKNVKTTGAIGITGTNIDLNAGTYESDDGNITFTGAVDLTVNTTVNSDTDNDSTDGNITFSSTINGAKTLALDADTGRVTLSGAVGGTTKLTGLTVEGSVLRLLGGVKATGAIAITGSTSMDLRGAYESDDGNITFTGAVWLDRDVTVDSDKDNDSDDGNITFSSTVNGLRHLTLDADRGNVTLSGAVGGSTNLNNLTITGGNITLDAVTLHGALSLTVPPALGTIRLNGNISIKDSDVTFDRSVRLGGDVTIDTDSDNDANDGAITFNHVVNGLVAGSQSLTLDADGAAVTLTQRVGGIRAPASLTITGGAVSLTSVTTIGAISVTGTAITVTGTSVALIWSNNGDITFTGPVTLNVNTRVHSDVNTDTTDGDISFSSTIDGGKTLRLYADTGSVTVSGAVGGTTKLTSLTVAKAGQVDVNTVQTTGAISITGTNIDLNAGTYESDDGAVTFTGPVDLTVNTTIDSDKDNDTADGAITFTSTVDGAFSLTLDASTGNVGLQGAVGGTTKLTDLTITGADISLAAVTLGGTLTLTPSGTITLKGNITTDDTNVSFSRPVVLAGNVTIDTDGDGDATDGSITFSKTVIGAYTLTLDADGGAVTLSDEVGDPTKLTSLTVTGGAVSLYWVETSGAITVTGTSIVLGEGRSIAQIRSDDGNITFTGAVTVKASYIVNSDQDNDGNDGNISFSSTVDGTITGAMALDADTGSVTISGAVGGSSKLFGLRITGGQIDLNSVKAIGASHVAGIDIKGTNIDLNSGVYESDDGNIQFRGPVDLTVNTTMDSDKDNDATDGGIFFTGGTGTTVNGAFSLTLDADGNNVGLEGAVGGTTKLTDLTITGNVISLNAVSLTGTLTLTPGNSIRLGGNITVDDTAVTFSKPVILTGNVAIDTDGDDDATDGAITFSKTVNGTHALTLDADGAAITLTGVLGNSTRLASLTVTGGAVSMKSVTATGAISVTGTAITITGTSNHLIASFNGSITFTGPVTIQGDTYVDSDNNGAGASGNISFSSTINGGEFLSLSAGRSGAWGSVTVSGAVGGTTKLQRLFIRGGQVDVNSVKATNNVDIIGTNIDLNAGVYESDDGSIAFQGPVDLTVNTTIDSDKDNDATDGRIWFTNSTSTVNGAFALTLDADTGNVDLLGAVGGTTKLTNLTITGTNISLSAVTLSGTLTLTPSGTITLRGNITVDDSAVSFSRPVVLAGNVTIDTDGDNDTTDGTITFSKTVNGTYALSLDADSANVDLQGAVGGTTKLASLTVTTSGGVNLQTTVKTTGVIAVTGASVILKGNYESDDGNITFTGLVVLNGAVTIDSDKDNDNADGNITFTQEINQASALTLDADGGSVTLSSGAGTGVKLASLTITGGQIDVKSVKTTGAISITGTNIDLNAGTYETDGGSITFTGPVDLTANVSVDTDADDSGNAGAITFTSTVDSDSTARSLTLDAGADGTGADAGSDAAVDLQGAVGGTNKLTNLTITGANISLAAVTLGGTLSLTPSGTITLKGNITTDDSAVSFSKAVTLAGNVTIDTDGDNDATDGAITFTKAVNGAFALTLDADGAAVTLSEDAGSTTKLASLTITGGQIDVKNVKTTGAISITGTNIDLNAGTYESDDGAITFTGPVDLTVNTTIDSDKDNDGTDGAISFSSTVNGGQTLTLDADGGNVTLGGPAGGTTKLTSLTITGGIVSLKAVKATGAIAVTGTTSIDLNGDYESDDGNITFTGAVWLAGAVTVDSDKDDDSVEASISFTSTVNGGQTLTLDSDAGDVTVGGAMGGTTPLTSLTVTKGRAISLKSVSTTGAIAVTGTTSIDLDGAYESDDGDITFTGAVWLAGATTVDSDDDNDSTDGDISFSSTINGGQTLTLDAGTGSVTLSGAVGGSTKLASLTVAEAGQVDVDSIQATGAISIKGTNIDLNDGTYESDDGSITFTGPVDLTVNTTIDSDKDNDSTDGAISFSSTIDGAKTLTLDASTGSVGIGGAVGGTTKLSSLTIAEAGQVDVNIIKTTGAISIKGTNIDLNAGTYESDDGNIAFTGPVDLAVNTTVDSDKDNDSTDGNISFSSTINGTYALTLDAGGGNVTLSGAAGETTTLASLTLTGGTVTMATVRATGAISVTGTAISLSHSGNVYVTSADGSITFTGPVTLAADTGLDSDNNRSGAAGNISFSSTINGGRALAINSGRTGTWGSVTLSGAVGGTTKLTSLLITAGQVDVSSIKTTSFIGITGTNIDLNAGAYESDDGRISFEGPVDLTANTTIDSDKDNDTTDGGILFFGSTSTVNGAFSLTLDADGGNVTVGGEVGGTAKLTSLTVSGGAVSLKTVKTSGAIAVTGSTGITLDGNYESDDANITFTGPVTLAGAVTVDSDKDNDSSDGAITFSSTINGGQTLSLDADSGAVTLSGAAGGTTRLASLTVTKGAAVSLKSVSTTGAIAVTGTGGITLNGTYSTNNADITFTGAVTLAGGTSVSSGAGGGNIGFSTTIDGAHALTLNAGTGAVTLPAALGGTTKLASLTVRGGQIDILTVAATGSISIAGSNIDLNAGTYESDDGSITFTGPVDLAANTTVDSDKDDDAVDGAISFSSTINGAHALTLDAGTGSVSLGGSAGSAAAKLTSLTVTGGSASLRSVFASGAITVTGTGGITLNGVYESDDAGITFTGPVTLAGAVTVDSDKNDDATDGAISFSSTIDGTHALTLDADTGAVTVGGVIGGAPEDADDEADESTTKLASLTVNGGAVSLKSAWTTGAIEVTGTGITLDGAYFSDDSHIKFNGPVTLAANVAVDSDKNDDNDETGEAAGGDDPDDNNNGNDPDNGNDVNGIIFTSTVDGAYDLTLNAGEKKSIVFEGDVGSTARLKVLTIKMANDVTVKTSMLVEEFEQEGGTGTTDFGTNTLNAVESVNVVTWKILGKIITKTAVLKADTDIIIDVEVDSLTIQANSLKATGTVGGVGGQGASNNIIIIGWGSGRYTMNGYAVLGFGAGGRGNAELSALPLSRWPGSKRRPATPAEAVFAPFSPVLLASVTGATGSPYAANVYEMPFPLLTPQPGTEAYSEWLPSSIWDVWRFPGKAGRACDSRKPFHC